MTLTIADLQQFTGSETIYRHALNNKVVYTDGVRYLAREGGAYWLIDEIALAQRFNRKLLSEASQVWTLTINNEDRTGILICDDGNRNRSSPKAHSLYGFCPAGDQALFH